MDLAGRPESLWLATAPTTAYPELDRDVAADVAVVGAGITGLLTALLLQERGLSAVVVDQHRVGSGATGHSTAKVSSLHQLTYAGLAKSFGTDGARVYGEANEAGLALIVGLADELGIACDLRIRPNYTYAESRGELADIEAEVSAARDAGLPASFVDGDDVPLPYPVAGAVCFDDQAEFHPVKFLVGIAKALEQAGGQIFENTRATSLSDGAPCRIETTGGTITADHVVVASHFPFPDRTLYFARIHPERSYAIAARLDDRPPEGMFINASSPTRSIRSHFGDGQELLLVGGEGHKVGQGGPTSPRYRALEAFARRHFAVRSVEYRWSTQDNVAADGVPLVGKLTPRSRASYAATGFRKWGFAMGAAAAEMIRDSILGLTSPWQELFDSNRFTPVASATDLVKENANVGFHFLADRLTRRARDSAAALENGGGRVVSRGGRQVAVSKGEDGKVRAVSARCTHMGCIVAWNDAERSWDCPCHGSRFAADGAVLQGPAVNPLEPRRPPR